MADRLKAVLFDLDGVVVDTAKYHYLAWKSIADQEGISFNQRINERLKGVSRMASLDILLETSSRDYGHEQKLELADKKNHCYVEMIGALRPEEILPGVVDFLFALSNAGIKRSICSASKNALMILDRLELTDHFDTVVSGIDTTRAKPDPEVFELAARRLAVPSASCLVLEDACAGLEGAKAAGMKALGIGDPTVLTSADMVYPTTAFLSLKDIQERLYDHG
jgi:beta-phosphoglucomutase